MAAQLIPPLVRPRLAFRPASGATPARRRLDVNPRSQMAGAARLGWRLVRLVHSPTRRGSVMGCVAGLLIGIPGPARGQDVHERIVESQPAVLWQKEGMVSFQRERTPERLVQQLPQPLNIGDSASTSNSSRALLFMRDRSPLRLRELTRLQLQPRPGRTNLTRFFVSGGQVYYVNRGQGIRAIPFETPNGEGLFKGTEFLLSVAPDGSRTDITMFDGEVVLTNAFGRVDVPKGRQGYIEAGQPPQLLPRIEAKNLVQWWVYYPGVLAPDELGLSEAERTRLAASLTAYRAGALPEALQQYPGYPTPPEPGTQAGRVYYAGLLLSVGAVDRAEAQLQQVSSNAPLARALRTMINAVTIDWSARFTNQNTLPRPGTIPRETGKPQPIGPNESGRADARRHMEWADGGTDFSLQGLTSDSSPGSESQELMAMTASELLALSYAHQATNNLKDALASVRAAVDRLPEFGFGWTRVAELEFSHGRTRAARQAVERAIAVAPRNAQAHALNGFLLAAENKLTAAIASFNLAIEIDPALGNAWLGRGLCKRRVGFQIFGLGGSADWQIDLQTAAILEPSRSLVRSYAGKAFAEIGDADLAQKELDYAKTLDANDPTPWLYSALLNREKNRINPAVDDLERSIELNENRALYRSRFLLDEDRAVRSANLAQMYQPNGMTEVAVREATRAVESEYNNASAHLFLANSYDALRDPSRIELRYETPWFHELLLANLLSPVGGGPLSQFVSQQEYSKLLQADGLGASILNEWRSDSELNSVASVFGTYGKTSFGFDVLYRNDDGDRPNSDDRRTEIYGQFKHEVTPNDIFYFLGKWQHQESGDTLKTYDNRPVSPGLRFEEAQAPGLLLAGWNHQWGPGANTLFLGGRLGAEQTLSNPEADQLLLLRDSAALFPGFVQNVNGFEEFTDPALRNAMPPAVYEGANGELIYSPALLAGIAPFLHAGAVTNVATASFDFHTRRKFEIYSAELQHIQEVDNSTIVLGGRGQVGEFETDARLDLIRPSFIGGFSTPAADQHTTVDFNRVNVYAYDFWNVTPWLTLIGGASWDRIEHPDNFRNPPVTDGQRTDEQLSGKAGFTFSPSRWFTMRGVYTEALGGVSFDESVTLEPVQLAGFNQAYRTVLSESIAGSVEAPKFKIWGLSVEGTLPTHTWWGGRFNVIEQDVDRTIGAFTGYDLTVFPISPAYFADRTTQRLAYREQAFESTINQLLGAEFAVGTRYRLTSSKFRSTFTEVPTSVNAAADLQDEAILHEISLYGNWNSPSGLFARVEANWYSQHLDNDPNGPNPQRAGDEFWQLNALLGFRFNRNRAEISVGVLNIAGTDYHLSPLNPYGDLPRERTGVVRCRFVF